MTVYRQAHPTYTGTMTSSYTYYALTYTMTVASVLSSLFCISTA